MPTLLELQHGLRQYFAQCDDEANDALLGLDLAHDRLDIYRNTIVSGLTKALLLSFPVVRRLVGADFFDSAARLFIAEHPPRAAYLDLYGERFPDFLRSFSPAASVPYLPDVASLEWAVNCAIHARDIEPIDLATLAAIKPEDQGGVSFVAHPSVCLLHADYPVDHIWRAVLDGDDEALAELDVDAGPALLLVERRTKGVEVGRLDHSGWRFLAALCRGDPLLSAIECAADLDASMALAEHLAAGRFVACKLPVDEMTPDGCEFAALRSIA